MRKKKKNNSGFTLVELIVVIVILAILIGVSIGGLYSWVNKARINTDVNNAAAIQSAVQTLVVDEDICKWAKTYNRDAPITIKWTSNISNNDLRNWKASMEKVDGRRAIIMTIPPSFNKKVADILTDGLPASKVGGHFTLSLSVVDAKPVITCKVYSTEVFDWQAPGGFEGTSNLLRGEQ